MLWLRDNLLSWHQRGPTANSCDTNDCKCQARIEDDGDVTDGTDDVDDDDDDDDDDDLRVSLGIGLVQIFGFRHTLLLHWDDKQGA